MTMPNPSDKLSEGEGVALVDSSTWTGRGPNYTGRDFWSYFPETRKTWLQQREICAFVLTVDLDRAALSRLTPSKE